MPQAHSVVMVTRTAQALVYGGSGAGYPFYNVEAAEGAVNGGTILAGDNSATSLSADDIVANAFVR